MKRKLLCGLLAALTLTCATVKAAPSRVVPVQVDGTVLSQGVNYLQSGVTYVPLRGLLDAFGGNVDIFIVGGAPMNQETESFLMKIKFPITIGYGMTECAPLISFTPDNEFKAGSCGECFCQILQK